MSDRVEIPIDTAKLVLARSNTNKVSSVSIGNDGRLVPNGSEDAEYKVTIRKIGKAEMTSSSSKANKLKACRGLKGCDFAECAKDVFGKLPKNLEGLCGIAKGINQPIGEEDTHV